MAGGMGVRKNEHIEHWAWRRENAEFFFKYSRANWARLAVFGFGVPLAVYHIIVNEIVSLFAFKPISSFDVQAIVNSHCSIEQYGSRFCLSTDRL